LPSVGFTVGGKECKARESREYHGPLNGYENTSLPSIHLMASTLTLITPCIFKSSANLASPHSWASLFGPPSCRLYIMIHEHGMTHTPGRISVQVWVTLWSNGKGHQLMFSTHIQPCSINVRFSVELASLTALEVLSNYFGILCAQEQRTGIPRSIKPSK
jgi:hypothetical protein